jgi:hypothetical protein
MTSFKVLRVRLMRKLEDWPDYRKHEEAPGMGMTWWKLAERMVKEKHISKVKKLVRRAEEVGLIK